MTMTSSAPVIMTETATEWRQLGRYLWAGRRDGRPVGTIEQGRRFVLTDADGDFAGAYRTLEEARAAAELSPTLRADLQGPSGPSTLLSRVVATAIVLGGGVAMGAGALAVLAVG